YIERDRKVGIFVYLIGRIKKNEIPDAVIIKIRLSAKPIVLVAKRKVDPVAAFCFQIWIADLERKCVIMRAIIVQLFQSGQTAGVRIVRDKRAAVPKRDTEA